MGSDFQHWNCIMFYADCELSSASSDLLLTPKVTLMVCARHSVASHSILANLWMSLWTWRWLSFQQLLEWRSLCTGSVIELLSSCQTRPYYIRMCQEKAVRPFTPAVSRFVVHSLRSLFFPRLSEIRPSTRCFSVCMIDKNYQPRSLTDPHESIWKSSWASLLFW